MASMNVSLPASRKVRVETRARTAGYSDASGYVQDLIRRERERADSIAEVQRLITEGFDSGISDRSMGQVLEAARLEVAPLQDR